MAIECVMYFCGGFLIAVLVGLVLFPAVHYRAVRLTRRVLEEALPRSLVEVKAEADCVRAQFAMSTCRLERTVEQLKFTSAIRLSEIEQKTKTINRLKAELARNTALTDMPGRSVDGLVPATPGAIGEHAGEVPRGAPAHRDAAQARSAGPAARRHRFADDPMSETARPKRKFTRFTLRTACDPEKPVLPLAMVSLAVAGERGDKHQWIEPVFPVVERHHRIVAKNGSVEKPLRPTVDLKKSLIARGQHLNECEGEIDALVHELAARTTSRSLQQ